MVFTKVPLPTKVPGTPAVLEIVLPSRHLVRVPAGADSDTLQAHLQEQQAAALAKSSPGAAIGYMLRNWVALRRYTRDKQFKIDNNGAEQALRPIVLGHKNWLFAGTEAAAHCHPVFAGSDLLAPADQSVRLSARRDPARLAASRAAVPRTDPTQVKAAKADLPRPSSRLNGAFLTIRPRLLLVSSISIYVWFATPQLDEQ